MNKNVNLIFLALALVQGNALAGRLPLQRFSGHAPTRAEQKASFGQVSVRRGEAADFGLVKDATPLPEYKIKNITPETRPWSEQLRMPEMQKPVAEDLPTSIDDQVVAPEPMQVVSMPKPQNVKKAAVPVFSDRAAVLLQARFRGNRTRASAEGEISSQIERARANPDIAQRHDTMAQIGQRMRDVARVTANPAHRARLVGQIREQIIQPVQREERALDVIEPAVSRLLQRRRAQRQKQKDDATNIIAQTMRQYRVHERVGTDGVMKSMGAGLRDQVREKLGVLVPKDLSAQQQRQWIADVLTAANAQVAATK